MSETEYVVVSTATDSEGSAKVIAEALVRERLAACARFHGVRSTYLWQGEMRTGEEHVVEIKTRRDLFDKVASLIRELHPYDLPQVVSTPILDGTEAYLRWIDEQVAAA